MVYEENNNKTSMTSEPSTVLYGLDYLKNLHNRTPNFEDLRAEYLKKG